MNQNVVPLANPALSEQICENQINLLLNTLYNTPEKIDCRNAILEILNGHRIYGNICADPPGSPVPCSTWQIIITGYHYCAALEEINTLGCIERTDEGWIIDPGTGYIYDPVTGQPHDPVTGLPIDLVGGGNGGNTGNQLELDCYNNFLNFIDYYKDKEDKPAEYDDLIRYWRCLFCEKCPRCLELPGVEELTEENQNGYVTPSRYIITFCSLTIPALPEAEEEEEVEIPDFPEIDLGTGVDDTWDDEEPEPTEIEADPMEERGPVWWYHSDHLGSTSYITDILGMPCQYIEYLPFGEVMVQQSTNNIFENVYKFNGKELDESTGYYYYGARYYDPAISIFLSVDPLAEQFPNWNPYHYVHNNPINMTDPTGMSANPIYGKNGDFLGTDNKGLQGKAIVMDEKNFKQGMNHEEALSYNLGNQGLNNVDAKDKLSNHYGGLKDRPDYDGYLTLNEANDWYRNGGGEPLFTDLGKIDLTSITPNQFNKKDVNYFNLLFMGNKKDGLVYGTIGLSNLGDNKVKGYFDDYDFDIRPWNSAGNVIRNIETKIGDWKAGKGEGFRIYFYGQGNISPNREVFNSNNPGLLKPSEIKW
jgi:RHS repeat-associated protein